MKVRNAVIVLFIFEHFMLFQRGPSVARALSRRLSGGPRILSASPPQFIPNVSVCPPVSAGNGVNSLK